jgi:hypothetical protein
MKKGLLETASLSSVRLSDLLAEADAELENAKKQIIAINGRREELLLDGTDEQLAANKKEMDSAKLNFDRKDALVGKLHRDHEAAVIREAEEKVNDVRANASLLARRREELCETLPPQWRKVIAEATRILATIRQFERETLLHNKAAHYLGVETLVPLEYGLRGRRPSLVDEVRLPTFLVGDPPFVVPYADESKIPDVVKIFAAEADRARWAPAASPPQEQNPPERFVALPRFPDEPPAAEGPPTRRIHVHGVGHTDA